MKRKLKIKNSKRGISLIELVVGITLVVVTFASCLGAMVGGYTTTIHNADEARMAVLNASLNEMIINTIRSYGATSNADIQKLIDTHNIGAAYTPEDNRLLSAVNDNVKAADGISLSTAVYVAPDEFTDPTPTSGVDYSVRYTLIPDSTSNVFKNAVNSVEITGVWIRTCFESATGPIFYESFIPYKS